MCKLLSSTIGIVSWQLLVIASSVNATNALPAGKYGCLTFLGGMNPMYGVGALKCGQIDRQRITMLA